MNDKALDKKRDDFMAPVSNAKGLADLVVQAEQQLVAASGRKLDTDKVARLSVLTRLAAQKNPVLLQCTRESLYWAFLDAARCGLEWDGEQGALVPFKDNRRNVVEATFLPMYRGLIHLAADSGVCHDIDAIAVFRGDKFRVILGTSRGIEHEPDLSEPRTWETMVACYAVFRLRDGSVKFDVMTKEEIEKRRAVSRARNGPWNDWPIEMAKKTVIKHGLKYLPRVSVALRDAVDIDNRADRDDGRSLSADEGTYAIAGMGPAPSKTRGTAALKAVLGGDDYQTSMPAEDMVRDVAEEPKEVPHPSVETTSTASPAPSTPKSSDGKATDDQVTAIRNLLDKGGARDADARLRIIGTIIGAEVQSIAALTWNQASTVIQALRGPQ